MLAIASSSRHVWRVWSKTYLQAQDLATYATAAYQSQGQSSSTKPPTVERAIRIKSQQKKREKYKSAGSQFPSIRQSQQSGSDSQYRFQDGEGFRASNSSKQSRSHNGFRDVVRDRSGYNHDNTSQRSSKGNRSPREFIRGRESAKGEDKVRDGDRLKGGERPSLRQTRHRISSQLWYIIKSAKNSSPLERERYFGEAQTIFDSLSGIIKRESRIYTAMLRIAVLAEKRKKALGFYTDMKKNGVAPDLFTYRAILEGFSNVDRVSSENTEVHAQVEKIFEAMVKDWESAIKRHTEEGRNDVEHTEADNVDTNSTAAAYSKSKDASLQSFIEFPDLFATSFVYYLRYLILLEDITGATFLLKRAKDLAATKEARRLIPQFLFQISYRFLSQIVLHDFGKSSEVESSIVLAFTLLRNSIIIYTENREKVAKDFGWTETETRSMGEAKEREQSDLNTALTYALIAMTKYEVKDKEVLASDALAEMYNDDHLASLPILSSEVGLRYGMQLCSSRNPDLTLQIFNRALEYHQLVTTRYQSGFKGNIPPDYRDVNVVWTNAMDVAVMKFDDVERGMDILEKAIKFKDGSTRLKPTRLPLNYTLNHFMRKIADQSNWEAALRLWKYWLQDDKKTRMPKEIFHLRIFIHFLMIAFRTEKKGAKVKMDCKNEEDKDSKDGEKAQKQDERPTRIAMKYLAAEIDPKDEYIWKWCQDALTKSKDTPKEKMTSLDVDNEKTAQKFLGSILMTSKMALDSGFQGADLASKSDVEAWRGIMRQAGRTLALGTGKQVFNHDEADWLRSGVGTKSPLALTLDDMRNLIGE